MRQLSKRVRRFLAWPARDRRAGIVSFGLLTVARLGVWFGGIPGTRQSLLRLAPRTDVDPARLAQIMASVSGVLPGPTSCLPRALVLEALLVASGRAAELRIGLAPRCGEPKPAAHAWVDLEGVPVAEDVSQYTPVPVFGTRG